MAMNPLPFAHNPTQAAIAGTHMVGEICVGDAELEYSARPGNIDWWAGYPMDNQRHIIAVPVPTHDHVTPVGPVGSIRFFVSAYGATGNIDWINLVNHVQAIYSTGPPVSTVAGGTGWCESFAPPGTSASHPGLWYFCLASGGGTLLPNGGGIETTDWQNPTDGLAQYWQVILNQTT